VRERRLVVRAWAPAALCAASGAWLALLLAVPAVRAADVRGMPAVAAAVVHAGCAVICHQRPERSLRVAGLPMPVCSRCTGLYAGGAVGAGLAWLTRRRRGGAARNAEPTRWRWPLVVAASPTALSWALETALDVPVGSVTRLVAALPLGATLAWVLSRLLMAEEGSW
jgi:hypothetical protein